MFTPGVIYIRVLEVTVLSTLAFTERDDTHMQVPGRVTTFIPLEIL